MRGSGSVLVGLFSLVFFPSFGFSEDKPDLIYLVVDKSGSIGERRLVEPLRAAAEEYVNTKPATTELRMRFFSTEATRVKKWSSLNTTAKGEFAAYCKEQFKPRGTTRLFDTVGEVLEELIRDGGKYNSVDIRILTDGKDEASGGGLLSTRWRSWEELDALAKQVKLSNRQSVLWVHQIVGQGWGAEAFPKLENIWSTINQAQAIFKTPPVAQFEVFPQTVFPGQPVTVVNLSRGDITNTRWDLGDGSVQTTTASKFTHTYQKAGSYRVSLVLEGAGTNSIAGIQVEVLDKVPLKAAFSAPKTVSVGERVQLIDNSQGDPGAYAWTFGPYGKSAEKNPSFVPDRVGEVSVELRISRADKVTRAEESATARAGIKVLSLPPDPAFSIRPAREVPLGTAVELVARDQAADTLHTWTIGDVDRKERTASVTWQAGQTGLIEVVHSVRNDGGGKSACLSIYVLPPNAPQADFVISPVTGVKWGDTVVLTALKNDPAWKHRWTIAGKPRGDASSASIRWQADAAGDVTIVHIVSNPAGSSTPIEKTLHVETGMDADFTVKPADEVDAGTLVTFEPGAKDPSLKHTWRVRGVPCEGGRWTASGAGMASVVHAVSGAGRGQAEAEKNIYVRTAGVPSGNFRILPGDSVLPGAKVSVKPTAQGPDILHDWDIGGKAFHGETEAWEASEVGDVKIRHSATDRRTGKKSEVIEKTLRVANPTPIPDFVAAPTEGDNPLEVKFTDKTENAGGVAAYAWDFGDESQGPERALQDPKHTYTRAGEFEVRMKVISRSDNREIACKKTVVIKVIQPPPWWRAWGIGAGLAALIAWVLYLLCRPPLLVGTITKTGDTKPLVDFGETRTRKHNLTADLNGTLQMKVETQYTLKGKGESIHLYQDGVFDREISDGETFSIEGRQFKYKRT